MNGSEFIPDDVSEKDVREEANKRASKLGYCTRAGEPPYRTKIQETVPIGRTKLNVWPRDKNGRLIDD